MTDSRFGLRALLITVTIAVVAITVAAQSPLAPSISAPGQPGLKFSPRRYSSNGNFNYAVDLGDLNGDGYPDMVVGSVDPLGRGWLQIALNRGDGTFRPFTFYPAQEVPGSVVVADFDGDGTQDVAVTSFLSPNIGIFFGNGDGTLRPEIEYPGLGGGTLAVGDFNHDGKPDLAWSYQFEIGVSLNLGGGMFGAPQFYPTEMGAANIAVGDMNNDGNPDLIVAEVYGGASGNGAVGVFLGSGDGTFQPELNFPLTEYGNNALAVADFNGDGNLDVVTNGCSQCDEESVGYLVTLRGRGNGTLVKPSTYRAVKGFVQQYVAADFNGDGIVDLASFGGPEGDGIGIFLGSGQPSFGQRVAVGTIYFRGITTGSLRKQGTGYADIVGIGYDEYVTVYLNQTGTE